MYITESKQLLPFSDPLLTFSLNMIMTGEFKNYLDLVLPFLDHPTNHRQQFLLLTLIKCSSLELPRGNFCKTQSMSW